MRGEETMSNIHPSSVIEDGAEIGEGCVIGPFCVIGAEVKLGNGNVLHSHVAITGKTTIGDDNQIYPFASIGHAPQDLKFRGEESSLVIGARNRIREGVTLNPGTADGAMETRIGDDCLFMANSHVAHDCILGNNIILANNAMVAGHVELGDFAIIGGGSGVHQFVRIGSHAMIGGLSAVDRDVIPYGQVFGGGDPLVGLNLIGLKRRGAQRDEIRDLQAAYRMLFDDGDGTLAERLERVRITHEGRPLVDHLLTFMEAESRRSYVQPAKAV
ncbi:MAG: acyl-ACP--UDP-N-acetylglucosamine O-acyltransferase [Alphaproteobacteria bacterium]